MDGNKVEIVMEGGEERLVLTYGHHKNSSRTSKPIPSTYLPLGEPLTLVLMWWIRVGYPKLRGGTMVSDDEVRAPLPSPTLPFSLPSNSCSSTSSAFVCVGR